MSARYSRWDDSQDPLGADLDAGEILDEMADELLSGYGANWSVQRLRATGIPGRMAGLDDIRRRLARKRAAAAAQLDLEGPLAEIAGLLEEVLELERTELESSGDEESMTKRALLDALPRDPAGAIRELSGYEFSSAEARSRFASLVEKLRRDVLDATFGALTSSMRSLEPADMERVKDMLADLNAMVAARERGDEYDFEGFMNSYGEMFPENPGALDDLLEAIAARMAAMSRLMASLTPGQRQELAGLAAAVMDDLDLSFQVDQLAQSLRALAPDLPWDEAAPWDETAQGWGEGRMPMTAAVDAIERIGRYEDIDRTLAGDYPGASLDDIDEDKLRLALDEDAVRDVRRLKEIERFLEDRGVLRRRRGRLELTPRGAKLLGERSLNRVLTRIRRQPSHRSSGGQAEPTGQTRPWTFGDEDPIHVQKTLYNAVTRTGARGSVKLTAEDFEVEETESRPRTATALLLDLSFSMPLRGHWVPAKKMALALNALIEGKYPEDKLYVIGFSDYARAMDASKLASAGWEEVHGTNMQHAFLLARRLLSEDRSPVKQVIMVTDGEPTAHLESDGSALFHWPPISVTIEKTLREAARLARSGITLNIFMLEETPGLISFMDRLARLTGGQVLSTASAEIGDTVLRRYMTRRGRGRAS